MWLWILVGFINCRANRREGGWSNEQEAEGRLCSVDFTFWYHFTAPLWRAWMCPLFSLRLSWVSRQSIVFLLYHDCFICRLATGKGWRLQDWSFRWLCYWFRHISDVFFLFRLFEQVIRHWERSRELCARAFIRTQFMLSLLSPCLYDGPHIVTTTLFCSAS